MDSKKRKFRFCIKVVIIAICLISLGAYLILSPDITVKNILDFTPDNLLAAAGVLFLLYTLKSVTFVLPIAVLDIVCGHLFPVWIALLISFTGRLIDLTLPYWIGYFLGIDTVKKLTKKYPKFEAILDRQRSNSFFICFFLRIIGGLPADVVTMYFGATEAGFRKNIIGGAIGLLPKTVLYTIWGSSISEPGSPEFWFSFFLILLISGGSLLGYYLYLRKLQSKQASSEGQVTQNN